MSLEAYRRRVAAEKRAAVVAAAHARFVERGYVATPLEDIARAAGVSTATVYKHFPSKAALFEEVAQAFLPDAEAELPPAQEGSWEALESVLRAYARMLTRPGAADLFHLIVAEARRAPELPALLRQRAEEPFLSALGAIVEVLPLRPGLPSQMFLTESALAMLKGALLWPQALGLQEPPPDAHIDEVVRGVVAWLKPHPSQ